MIGNSASRASRRLARVVAVLTGCLGLVVTQQGYAAGVWTNEPAGAAVVIDCPFSVSPFSVSMLHLAGVPVPGPIQVASSEACNSLGVSSPAQFTLDATAPLSPPTVLQSTLYAGNPSGGIQLRYTTPQANREIFMGIMWRTNLGFQGRSDGNKLFSLRGPSANGVWLFGNSALVNGSAPLIFSPSIGAGLDNSHICALDFGSACYPNVGDGMLHVGPPWTKIEAYVKSSTTNTSRDGIVRWWINGRLVGNYTNLNYGGQAGINEWAWSEEWHDVYPVPFVDWSHFIDHIHISIPNAAPIVVHPISDQVATEDTAFTFTFAAETFKDIDAGDTLTYAATQSSGAALPAWLRFTPATRTFSGTPTNADVGVITVRVTARDRAGAMAFDDFTITVRNTNHVPTVAMPISDQAATEDTAFSFTFAADTFKDIDAGDTLTYAATQSSDAALPAWLRFTPATRTFSGTPTNADVGVITVRVTARDRAGAMAFDDFTLTVKAARSLTITNNYNPNASDHFIVRLRIASTDANQAAERLGLDTPPCACTEGASVGSPDGRVTIPKTAIPGIPNSLYEVYIGFGYWAQDCGAPGTGWNKYNLDTLGGDNNRYHYINVMISEHSSGGWTIDIGYDGTMRLTDERGVERKIATLHAMDKDPADPLEPADLTPD